MSAFDRLKMVFFCLLFKENNRVILCSIFCINMCFNHLDTVCDLKSSTFL